MTDSEIEQNLKREAAALLSLKKVDYIIGFEKGSTAGTAAPFLARSTQDAERLIISPFASVNLARYLTEIRGRAGIVARGCESRSIISLIQDKKVFRQNVVILGVPCTGIIDRHILETRLNGESAAIGDISSDDGIISLKIGRKTVTVARAEVLADCCRVCDFPNPVICDIALGEGVPPVVRPSGDRKAGTGALTGEAIWRYWENEFRRCIRCYACRNSCPACFCKVCFAEESEPQWLAPLPRWQENLTFQVIRCLHLAGRCTDCGACERACPVHIPLRRLTREMYDLVAEVYHYRTGTNEETPPFLGHYENSDPDNFIK